MACDMVVAIGGATADGRALFGYNCGRPAQERHWLHRAPGRTFAPGEKVRTQTLELPQVRQTFTALGTQSGEMWGYHQGVNEHGVALGVAALCTRQGGEAGGLPGTDLVRLAVERSATALQALDNLTDLISRHGQYLPAAGPAGKPSDTAFLVADPHEAFALEASGRHWVCQEVCEVRAVSDACTIRQDWNRIAPGLAAQAIDRGWWPGDGSKLDFGGALGTHPSGRYAGLRRWARATMLLQQQNGRIDSSHLRRLLADHGEGATDDAVLPQGSEAIPLCQHGGGPFPLVTATSLIAELAHPCPRVWVAFGAPCESVYFPIYLAGDLPEPFCHGGRGQTESVWQHMSRLHARLANDPETRARAHECLAQLQGRFDVEAEEFAADAAASAQPGLEAELSRQAGLFMQHVLELFEETLVDLLDRRQARRLTAAP